MTCSDLKPISRDARLVLLYQFVDFGNDFGGTIEPLSVQPMRLKTSVVDGLLRLAAWSDRKNVERNRRTELELGEPGIDIA